MRQHRVAGNPTTSLGNLLRCLTTLTIKKKSFFLCFKKISCTSVYACCLLPSLGTPEKSLAPMHTCSPPKHPASRAPHLLG